MYDDIAIKEVRMVESVNILAPIRRSRGNLRNQRLSDCDTFLKIRADLSQAPRTFPNRIHRLVMGKDYWRVRSEPAFLPS